MSGNAGALVEKQIQTALRIHGLVAIPAPQALAAARAGDAQLAAVAHRLKVAAVVEGEVRDRGTRAQIKAHGADGGVIAEGAWSVPAGGKKLAAAVGRSIWSRFGAALAAASPPAPARRSKPEPPSAIAAAPSKPVRTSIAMEPTSTPPPTPPPGPAAADAEGSEFGETPVAPRGHGPVGSLEREGGESRFEGQGPAILDVAVGPRLVSRDLSWNKVRQGTVTPISVGNAPAVGFQAAWYPASHFTRGWPTYIGVVASGEYTPGGNAQVTGGATYPTSDSDYWGGVRVRVPRDGWDAELTLGYGQHAFVIRDGTNAARADLAAPDMIYSYLRIGADARVPLGTRFSLTGGLAYRDVLSAGTDGSDAQAQMFFPKATLTAIDANLGLGFRVTPLIEARLGVDLRRYGFDMHPAPTDALIVSGAIDQYIAYWLNVAVMLDGKS